MDKLPSLEEKNVSKPGITIEIPGFGRRVIRTVVSDYTGTLSCTGNLVPGVRESLLKLLDLVEIEIVTSDSYGTARQELSEILVPHYLTEERHDVEKQDFVRRFDIEHVAAFGNGNNDRLLLKTVKQAGGLAIAVDNGEGCALDALLQANLFVVGAVNALNLLLETKACEATLRF
jgi:soluble P-type ATPase